MSTKSAGTPSKSPTQRPATPTSTNKPPPTSKVQKRTTSLPTPIAIYNQRSKTHWGPTEWFLIVASYILIVIFPISLCFCWITVKEYERSIVFRFGRLLSDKPKGPGLTFVLPCVDSWQIVDLRTLYFDVPPQEILTKDSVTIAVDAVVYYRIFDATIAVINVENYKKASHLLSASILRNMLGQRSMAEILTERESISQAMQQVLDDATDPWGVKVERVEIKDVRLPQQLQRAMAAEAEATREAKAKVIAAEGEQRASRALKEAAMVIMESPAAMQLRYLQTLNTIAAEKNSTIIFPLPMEFLPLLAKK